MFNKNKSGSGKIDYSFDNGLNIADAATGETVDFVSQAELKADSARLNERAKDVPDPEHYLIDLDDERQMEVFVFNPDAKSNDVIIYNYQWSGYYGGAQGPASEYHEAAVFAAAFPDKKVIVVNQPGFGGSDALPDTMSARLGKTGDYEEVGATLGEGLKKFIQNKIGQVATLAVLGSSQGALRVMPMVEHLAEVADKTRVALVDPPGSKSGLLRLITNFVVKEGVHGAGYRHAAAAIDPESAAARLESAKFTSVIRDKILKKKPNADQANRKAGLLRRLKQTYWDAPRSMARPALERNLSHLQNSGVDRVDLYSLERSEVSDIERVKQIVGSIGKEALNLRHFVIQGATHAFAKGKPIMDVELVHRLFDDDIPGGRN